MKVYPICLNEDLESLCDEGHDITHLFQKFHFTWEKKRLTALNLSFALHFYKIMTVMEG